MAEVNPNFFNPITARPLGGAGGFGADIPLNSAEAQNQAFMNLIGGAPKQPAQPTAPTAQPKVQLKTTTPTRTTTITTQKKSPTLDAKTKAGLDIAAKRQNTEDIKNLEFAAKTYGYQWTPLAKKVAPKADELKVEKGKSDLVTGGTPDISGNLDSILSGANAYTQAIGAQLQKMQTDYDQSQNMYQEQLKAAETNLSNLSKFDAQALYDTYAKNNQLKETQDALTKTQLDLTTLNQQLQQEVQAIRNKPVLGSIIRGQEALKIQEYAPQITALQAQADIYQGNLDSAEKRFTNYYNMARDSYVDQKSNYERLYDLADRKLIDLDSKEREVINNKINLLNQEYTRQEANKKDITNLMLSYPQAFAKGKVSPTDDYNSAVRKMSPYMTSTKQYPAGIVGEYEYYKDQEMAAGRKPVSFNDYQTLDANRKASVARAGASTTITGDRAVDALVKQINETASGYRDRLAKGEITWASAFDAMKKQFSGLKNEEIDAQLGGSLTQGPSGNWVATGLASTAKQPK